MKWYLKMCVIIATNEGSDFKKFYTLKELILLRM